MKPCKEEILSFESQGLRGEECNETTLKALKDFGDHFPTKKQRGRKRAKIKKDPFCRFDGELTDSGPLMLRPINLYRLELKYTQTV